MLADYAHGFTARWQTTHPGAPVVPAEQVSSYWIEDNYPPEYRERIEHVQEQPGFFRDLPPLPGAIEAMHRLLDAGHDVRICTAPMRRYQHCVLEKYQWIEEHLGADWTDRIVLTRDKTLIAGDCLIDDRPDVTGALAPDWTRLLFTQPYNRSDAGWHINWRNYRDVLAQIQVDRARRGVLRHK